MFVKYNILRAREFIRDAERYFLQKELARFVNLVPSLSDEIFFINNNCKRETGIDSRCVYCHVEKKWHVFPVRITSARFWREQERERPAAVFFFSWITWTKSFSKTMLSITIFFQESSIVRCEKIYARETDGLANFLFSFLFFTRGVSGANATAAIRETIFPNISFLCARHCERDACSGTQLLF